MKKKVISVVLASAMAMTLAACGGAAPAAEAPAAEAPAAEETTEEAAPAEEAPAAEEAAEAPAAGPYDPASAGDVTIGFGWWGNQVRDEVTKAATDHFTELYPNVTFNLNAQTWNDYWAQMTSFSSSDTLPDLMQQDYAYFEQWVEAGDLLDLTPYVESGALDLSKLPESIVQTGVSASDGHIYAVCAGMNAPGLSYNKTLTDELGIEVPDNMTWDQFVDISREIYEKSGVGVLWHNLNSENPITYFARGKGHEALFTTEGVTVTPEEMTEYYTRLKTGVEEGWLFSTEKCASVDMATIPQHPLVFGSDPSVRSWCAFNFSNQYLAFANAAEADGIELGITSWPEDNPTQANYLKPSQFFSITTDTKNPDLAVAVLNYLINDVEANTLLRAERGIPANTEVAAAIAEEVSKVDASYPIIVDYLDFVGDNSSAIFPPLPGYAGTVNTDVIQHLTEEALDPASSETAEDLGAAFVDEANQVASSY
ncbi:MAG: extracellular solute-binding protein [Lachnospiraceae bacterium]|nr:extracellular solute-binding protein [Lachnospiraceae bacterium]